MSLNHSTQFSQLTDDQFAAIGKIVIEWSNIEFLLGVLLSRLLLTPEFTARSYTNSMSAIQLQEAIKEAVEIHKSRYLYKIVTAETINKILELNSQISSLRLLRNKISHYCWARFTDKMIFGTSFPSGAPSLRKDNRSYSILNISELKSLHTKAHEIVEHMNLIISSLPPICEKEILLQLSGN